MFLTKVLPSRSFVLSSLTERANRGDVYAQHQLLWRLFPDQTDREFLFRYELGRDGPCYYVLSRTEPGATPEGVRTICKAFHPKLKAGDRLAYTLRANPTLMLKSGRPGQRGQRVDVLMHAKAQAKAEGESEIAQIQQTSAQNWLMNPKRQDRLGVAFLALPEVTEHQQHQVYKSRGNNHKPIRFTSVNYRGVLSVTDPARFLEALGQGIGRAKAMGCGLMMIRPCP